MQAFRVALAGTARIAATARGFRQAALDHGFRCAEKSLYQPLLLLTHNFIFRYTYPFLLSIQKRHE